MNLAEFRALLLKEQPQFKNLPCRLAPSSFKNEASPALPRAFDWYWSSCENVLRGRSTKGVMMRLPLSWQIEPALYAVCRRLQLPILASDPANIPLATAALEATAIDAVVTIADTFATELALRGIELPTTWLYVHPIDADTWSTDPMKYAPNARHEVHLFPGFPILYSCEEGNFHPSEEYTWEYDKTSAFITNHDSLSPFDRLEVPVPLKAHGMCACGKEIILHV